MNNNILYAVVVISVSMVAIASFDNDPSLTTSGQTLAETRQNECEEKGGIFVLSYYNQPVFSVCIEGDKVLNYTSQLPGLWK